jgi:glutathione synthase/RimK-type ligase-like ATP-grasp enzyme
MPIAIATSIAAFGLDHDETPLREALARRQIGSEVLAWDDPSVSWGRFDAVLIRSTWDYIERPELFLHWCERVAADVPLWNPLATIRWNSDKHYLAELRTAGLAVVESHFIEPGSPPDSFPPLDEFVVKPAISAGSRDTERYAATQRELAVKHVARLLDAGRSVLVQPYLSDVDTDGETGLLFFDGQFSHAIRKGPILRDGAPEIDGLFAFGDITARDPSDAEKALAASVLAALPHPTPLYARVDLLPSPDGPLLLELELVEPSLFFATSAGSADRLAEAVQKRLT